jgi:hypothetical protein
LHAGPDLPTTVATATVKFQRNVALGLPQQHLLPRQDRVAQSRVRCFSSTKLVDYWPTCMEFPVLIPAPLRAEPGKSADLAHAFHSYSVFSIRTAKDFLVMTSRRTWDGQLQLGHYVLSGADLASHMYLGGQPDCLIMRGTNLFARHAFIVLH